MSLLALSINDQGFTASYYDQGEIKELCLDKPTASFYDSFNFYRFSHGEPCVFEEEFLFDVKTKKRSMLSSTILPKKNPVSKLKHYFDFHMFPFSQWLGKLAQELNPVHLQTFPEAFQFKLDRCIGLHSSDAYQSLNFEQSILKLLKETIFTVEKNTKQNITSVAICLQEQQTYLSQLFQFMCEKMLKLNCSIFFQKDVLAFHSKIFHNTQKHFFLNLNYHASNFYFSSQNDFQETSYAKHDLNFSIFNLDLYLSNFFKKNFFQENKDHSVHSDPMLNFKLFQSAVHTRLQVKNTQKIRVLIAMLSHSKLGLHDFDHAFSSLDYQSVMQNHYDQLFKQLDQFFIAQQTLPSQVDNIYLIGESNTLPLMQKKLSQYFQKNQSQIQNHTKLLSQLSLQMLQNMP